MMRNRNGETAITAALLLLAMASGAPAGQNEWTTSGPNAVVNTVIAREAPLRLYAGAEDGLYLAAGEELIWESVGTPFAGQNVISLAVEEGEGGRIYAGLNTGLYYSSDGGEAWTRADAVGPGVLSLATGTAGSGLVHAGTFGRGVFTSADGGDSWRRSDDLADAIVFSIATTGLAAGTAYAGTADGLFTTNDGGVTWRALGDLGGLSIRAIHPSPQDADVILAATFGSGVFESRDAGQTWSPSNAGLTDLTVRDLAVDSRSDQVVYAATSTGGFFRSKDGGSNWLAINEGLPSLRARSVYVDPANPERLLGTGPSAGVFEIEFSAEPQIELNPTSLNFGSSAVGVVARMALEVANTGGKELVVTSISPEGSGFFSVSPTSLVVAPQETGQVEVRFLPQTGSAQSDTLVVRSTDPDESQLRVPLRGIGVQAELRGLPATLNFGQVRIGEFRDTTLVLSNGGNGPLALANAFFDDTAFRVLSFETRVLQPSQTSLLLLRFVPLRASGISSKLIVLTDIASQPRVTVQADGVGTAPDVSVSATSLDFGTVDLGGFSRLTLDVSNSGNSDLTIDGVELAAIQFRVAPSVTAAAPLVLAPGAEQRFEVTYLPLLSGTHLAELTILSDAPGVSGSLDIPLSGSGGALTLTVEPPVPAGISPVDMVVADLNQDGVSDLAIADSTSGFLQVLVNDGKGVFPEAERAVYPGPGSEFQEWDQLVAIAAAPIFGSAPDLVVADGLAQTVSVLTNDGSGSFAGGRRDIFMGTAITDVLLADLDADGDIDIAVADGDRPTVTILLNNDEGSFNARTSLPVGSGPQALAAGNLNADGHADLVVANVLAGTVSILLNDRNGGFLARQDLSAGQQPVAVAVVDHDADGDNDILSANRGSRDVSVLDNAGDGVFALGERIQTGMAPSHLVLSDMTSDVFSDLVVAGPSSPFIAFFENNFGSGFVRKDILTVDVPARRIGIADLDADGDNDIAVLSTFAGELHTFLNADTRRLDPPRAPTEVTAADVPRDLGRSIQVTWQAPDLDEQIGRTTEYAIFRSASATGPFVEIGRVPAGRRQFVDVAATLGETFFYNLTAGNAAATSPRSDTAAAASEPAPFFELELVDEPRLSVGDTLRVRVFLTAAQHAVAGISLYLSFDDTSLTLIDADPVATQVLPFRPDTTLGGGVSVVENRLHPDSVTRIDISIAGLSVPAGVQPVPLGEIWFQTIRDRSTAITIDDEESLNRRSAVVEAVTGDFILPFIPDRPTQVAVRDFQVKGVVNLEGRVSPDLAQQVTLTFVDTTAGVALASPLNDENRSLPGIQYTLEPDGSFTLAQIPAGQYRVFLKSPSHLRGTVGTGLVTIGGEGLADLTFQWLRSDLTVATTLGAGDATDDNRVNLADYGLLVRHFNATSADQLNWPAAQASDFNGDEVVNTLDFFLLAQNFGEIGEEIGSIAEKRLIHHHGGTVHVADEPTALVGSGLGSIVGVAVSVEPAGEGAETGPGPLELSTRGTVFAGRRLLVHQWSDGSALHLVAALQSPLQGVEGEGTLLYLDQVGFGAEVRRVEILRSDGVVTVPALITSRGLPQASQLLQNFPNPFNPATTIPFAVGGGLAAKVRLDIYDLLGQHIRTLVDDTLPAGQHQVRWDGRDGRNRAAASGIYIYSLQVLSAPARGGQATAQQATRRLLLIR